MSLIISGTGSGHARTTSRSRGRPAATPFALCPGRFIGEYLASLIAPSATDGGNRQSRLRIVTGECVSITQLPSSITITLSDGSLHRGEFAVLATGHEASAGHTGRYLNPWIRPADAGVASNSSVLLLGTGLTMVDYVLSLIRDGHKGPIFAMSRRGLLPRAHRKVELLPIDRADVPFGKGMPDLLSWLRNLIYEHATRGGDWRGVVDGIRPFTQQIWQQLPLPARRSFIEHARAWWEVHRHRMAPEVERRIDATIGSGRLTVIAAKLYRDRARYRGCPDPLSKTWRDCGRNHARRQDRRMPPDRPGAAESR